MPQMFLFCYNNIDLKYISSLWNDIKTVYKILKDKTNYLYSIGDYKVINWIIEAALT